MLHLVRVRDKNRFDSWACFACEITAVNRQDSQLTTQRNPAQNELQDHDERASLGSYVYNNRMVQGRRKAEQQDACITAGGPYRTQDFSLPASGIRIYLIYIVATQPYTERKSS